jgi:xanthine dehydrogenase accessory factor
MTAAVMAWALSRLAGGQRVVLASVVETAGSVPGKVGARLAMSMNQDWTGTVGGAGLEMKVLARCRELLTLNPTAVWRGTPFRTQQGCEGL